MTERIAVVLLSTGGPDSKKAILPYLYNYYSDPQNLPLPFGFRTMGAFFTALTQRFTTMRETYRRLGFQSPLLQNTKSQAISLERVLNASKTEDVHYRCYVSMVYWHPFSDEVMDEIKTYDADRVILLPMFPQKSLKTTYAMVKDWLITAQEEKLDIKTQVFDEFYHLKGFSAAAGSQISPSMYRVSDKARRAKLEKPRVIFVARYHPPRLKKLGDPYAESVEKTAQLIIEAIGGDHDYRVCYQPAPTLSSTIGPVLDETLQEAADDNIPVLIFPISYAVEDPVTMVMFDQLYAEHAKRFGVPLYERAKAVGNHNDLMVALSEVIIAEDTLIDLEGYDERLKDKLIWDEK
jgi:ferrochelatase